MLHLYINVKLNILLAQLANSEEALFTPLSCRKLTPEHALAEVLRRCQASGRIICYLVEAKF